MSTDQIAAEVIATYSETYQHIKYPSKLLPLIKAAIEKAMQAWLTSGNPGDHPLPSRAAHAIEVEKITAERDHYKMLTQELGQELRAAHASGMFSRARFNGSDYNPEFDDKRLRGQIARVYGIMFDGQWRTLSEIESITGDPPASISAQLRHLRKKRFGSHTVNKRPRGDRVLGLFEYQLIPNAG